MITLILCVCFLNEFCQHVFFQCVLNNEFYLKRAKFTLLVITICSVPAVGPCVESMMFHPGKTPGRSVP